jgi:enamine deaminase RidA (YjgF/YER057c/UK114 family)
MTDDRKVVQPPGWARPRGYVNGLVAEGRMLFVGGQIGWDPTSETPRFPDGFAAQFEQALLNVLAVVREAGGAPENIARMTVYVTDKHAYIAAAKDIGAAWRRLLGKHYPAMALVQVSALLEDRAMVEIEATAVL